MTNALKEKFEKGEPALGFALMYPSPSSMECTAAGWDWVWVDAQHGQMDYATILYTIQIAELLGLSTIVRPSGNELNMFGPILDACATGLMVPMVNSVEQAREVVKAFYFPPLGERSYGGRRVIDVHGREYYQEANDNVLLVAQIETPEALQDAEQIAAVDGVDVIFFSPDDLKIRMDLPINSTPLTSDELGKAMQQVGQAARNAGKIAGCIGATAESLKMAVSEGYLLVVGGADAIFLRTASTAKIEELRAALDS